MSTRDRRASQPSTSAGASSTVERSRRSITRSIGGTPAVSPSAFHQATSHRLYTENRSTDKSSDTGGKLADECHLRKEDASAPDQIMSCLPTVESNIVETVLAPHRMKETKPSQYSQNGTCLQIRTMKLTKAPRSSSDPVKVADLRSDIRDSNSSEVGFISKTKNYLLNRQNALKKKLDGCFKDHIQSDMKSKGNFVITFSTSAYEMAKYFVFDILQSDSFSEHFFYIEESGKDITDSTVEMRYKIFNKKKDGQSGLQTKMTINCYHTTSKMLINGNRVDYFVDNYFPMLERNISDRCPELDDANFEIKKQIENINIAGVVVHTAVTEDGVVSQNNIQAIRNPVEDVCHAKHSYACPVCGLEAKNDTIACEECDLWFHYSCVGLNNKDAGKISESTPYICVSCNDNILYYGTSQLLPEQNAVSQNMNETDCVPAGNVDEHYGGKINLPLPDSQTYVKSAVPSFQKPRVELPNIVVIDHAPPNNTHTDNGVRTTCSKPAATLNMGNQVQSKTNVTLPQQKKKDTTSLKASVIVINGQNYKPQNMHSKTAPEIAVTKSIPAPPCASAAKRHELEQNKLVSEQTKYILDLERKVKELERAVNLIKVKESLDGSTSVNYPNGRDTGIGTDAPSTPHNGTLTHIHRHTFEQSPPINSNGYDMQLLDARVRQLEMNTVQNLSVFTASNLQIGLQLQQQALVINNLQQRCNFQQHYPPTVWQSPFMYNGLMRFPFGQNQFVPPMYGQVHGQNFDQHNCMVNNMHPSQQAAPNMPTGIHQVPPPMVNPVRQNDFHLSQQSNMYTCNNGQNVPPNHNVHRGQHYVRPPRFNRISRDNTADQDMTDTPAVNIDIAPQTTHMDIVRQQRDETHPPSDIVREQWLKKHNVCYVEEEGVIWTDMVTEPTKHNDSPICVDIEQCAQQPTRSVEDEVSVISTDVVTAATNIHTPPSELVREQRLGDIPGNAEDKNGLISIADEPEHITSVSVHVEGRGSDHNIADFVDTNTENSRNSNNQSFLGIAGLHGRPPEIVNQKISTLKSQ
ncbi:MAG: PHD finger domain-containing protein [Sedimenticola sp.]